MRLATILPVEYVPSSPMRIVVRRPRQPRQKPPGTIHAFDRQNIRCVNCGADTTGAKLALQPYWILGRGCYIRCYDPEACKLRRMIRDETEA